MKYLSLLFASVLLSSVSVPVEAAQTDEQPSNDVAQLASHSVWANVNQIKFLEEHVSANSGIMRLKLGETITVKALVTYSGDIQPILQSVVQFENVDPALKIEHDPSSLVFHNKLATFTFNITLTQPINRPALFSVKVADGQPGDRHHLTPYSQCQTVEQKAGGTGGVTDPDPNPNPKPDNPDENPDETPDNPDENPDETPDNPDENPDVTPDNPDGNPDVTPDNPDENPDAKPDKPEGNNGNYEGDNEEDGNGGHGGEEVIKPQIHPEGSNPTITIPEQVKPLSQIRKQSIPSVGTTDVLVNKKSSENAKEILPMTKIAHSSNQAANYKNSSTATEEATKQLPKTGEHNRFFTWIFGLLITGMSMVTFRKIN